MVATKDDVLRLIEKAAIDNQQINFDPIVEAVERSAKALPVEPSRSVVPGMDATLRTQDENSIQSQARRAPVGIMEGVGGPGGMFYMLPQSLTRKQIPDWSIFPNYRDGIMRNLWKNEPLMAGAVYSMGSRIKSLDYMIKGPSKRLNKYFEDFFAESEFGKGYGDLIFKGSIDLNTTDNGAFFELAGPGHILGERKGLPTAIHHLDSQQCWRTFDPDYPVIYLNPMYHTYHLMHKSRVMSCSSMPQPDELARGIGFCAVSRSLMILEYIRDVQTYKQEKVSGRFTRAIGYGDGYTPQQFSGAMDEANADAKAQGFRVYKGIPFLFSMKGGSTLSLLDMASLPDGFNFSEELVNVMGAYALAFGVDIREFWPASSPGASKADAAIQHLKTRGKGYADILQTLESMYVVNIFPKDSETKLVHDYTDPEQDKTVEEVEGLLIDNLTKLLDGGVIDEDEARAIYINKSGIDTHLLKSDAQREADKQKRLEEQQQQMVSNPKLTSPGGTPQKVRFPNEQGQQNQQNAPKPLATPDHSQPRKTFMPDNPAKKSMDEELSPEELDSIYEEYQKVIKRD